MDRTNPSIVTPMGLNLCSSCRGISQQPLDDSSITQKVNNKAKLTANGIGKPKLNNFQYKRNSEVVLSNNYGRIESKRRQSENLQNLKLARLSKSGMDASQLRKILTTIREESFQKDISQTREDDLEATDCSNLDSHKETQKPSNRASKVEEKTNELKLAKVECNDPKMEMGLIKSTIDIGEQTQDRSQNSIIYKWRGLYNFKRMMKKSSSVQPLTRFNSNNQSINLKVPVETFDKSLKTGSTNKGSFGRFKIQKLPKKKGKTSPLKPIMGLSPLKSKIKPLIRILVIGLDNAGKTSVIRNLKGDMSGEPTVSTIGFSNVRMRNFRQKYEVELYDVGGSSSIRSIWANYLGLVHGLIFVIDSAEGHRFEEARNCLKEVLSDYRAQNKPLLVYMNKQDLENSEDEFEINHQLRLDSLINRYRCPTKIEAGSAIRFEQPVDWTESEASARSPGPSLPQTPTTPTTMNLTIKTTSEYNLKDTSIESGYNWLLSYIDKNYQRLQERVNFDSMRQTEKENKSIQDRFLRFHSNRHRRSNQTAIAAADNPSSVMSSSRHEGPGANSHERHRSSSSSVASGFSPASLSSSSSSSGSQSRSTTTTATKMKKKKTKKSSLDNNNKNNMIDNHHLASGSSLITTETTTTTTMTTSGSLHSNIKKASSTKRFKGKRSASLSAIKGRNGGRDTLQVVVHPLNSIRQKAGKIDIVALNAASASQMAVDPRTARERT